MGALDVLVEACKYHWRVLKCSFYLILLMAIAQLASIYLSPYLSGLFSALSIVFLLFCWGAMFLQVNAILTDQSLDTLQACRAMLRRAPSFFATFFLIIAVVVGYYFVFQKFIWSHMAIPLLGLFVLVVPIVVILLLFIFALPLILLKNPTPFNALGESAYLVRDELFETLTIYIVFALFYFFILLSTQHAQFLRRHHVLWLFNAVSFLAWMPLLTNYIILMLYEFQGRIKR